MAKSYFKAVHSNGSVHLRASDAGRPYAFAVVCPTIGGASFGSKRPGPLNSGALANGCEIVEAKEITKTEYTALDKANKIVYQVTFLGQKVTASFNRDGEQPIAAVGDHRPEGKYNAKYPDVVSREYAHVHWLYTQADVDLVLARDATPGVTHEVLQVKVIKS